VGFGRPQSRGSTSTSSGIPPQLGLRGLGEEGPTVKQTIQPKPAVSGGTDTRRMLSKDGWGCRERILHQELNWLADRLWLVSGNTVRLRHTYCW
jgi:hypothetical protein